MNARNDHVNFVNFQSSYEAIRISHSELHFTHIIPARAVSGPGYFVETHPICPGLFQAFPKRTITRVTWTPGKNERVPV